MIPHINYLLVGNDEELKSMSSFVEKLPFSTSAFYCENLNEAHQLYISQTFDVIVLDADNKEFENLEFSQKVTAISKIIVVSASEQHSIKAFEIGAIDYLIKPYTFESVSIAFLRAINANITDDSVSFNDKLVVKAGRKIEIIVFEQIQYIEAFGIYSKIFLDDGKIIIANSVLAKIEPQLLKKKFQRVHRSFIVNINKITSFDKKKVFIQEKEIEIGASFKHIFEKTLEHYY